MALSVDPPQQSKVAGQLDAAVESVKGAVPTEEDTFVRPPGGDPISIAGAARLTGQATELVNRIIEGLNELAAIAFAIGAAAERYSRAEIESTRAIAGAAGGEPVANPVVLASGIPLRTVSTPSADLPTDGIDEGEFATLLELGAGVGPVELFLGSWADVYGHNAHPAIGEAIVETTTGVQDWSDVGTEKVAPLLDKFREWHDDVRAAVVTLAQRATNFLEAFKTVSAFDTPQGHPSKETIEQAKQNVQRAKTKTREDQAIALRELELVKAKAQDAQQKYFAAVVQGVPDRGFDLAPPPDIANPTSVAVNDEIPPGVTSGPATNGAGPATNGASGASGANTTVAEKSDSGPTGADDGEGTDNGENSSEDLRSVVSGLENALGNTDAENPGVGQAENPAGNAGNQNQAVDPNAAQLANSLGPQNQGQNAGAPFDESAFEDSLGDPPGDYGTSGFGGGYDPGVFGGGGGGGVFGGGGGGVRPPDTRTAALGSGIANSSAAPSLASEKKFPPVAASGNSEKGTFGGRPGMMPMGMPMGGAGMGNNQGNGGNPTKFTPDAKVVAEDKLPKGLEHHTVNEKPPVVPDATKETLLAAGRKSDTNQGGTPA